MREKNIFYRYRRLNITDLKDIIEEIKNREIYLATLEENNDPMDGLQDVYWDGDEVIWRNFIRHYSRCLLNSLIYINVAGDTKVFNEACVNTQITPDDVPTREFGDMFNDFLCLVAENKHINDLVRILIAQKCLHKDELDSLLFYFNSFFLILLRETIKKHMGYDALPGIEYLNNNLIKVNHYDLIQKADREHLRILSHISIKINQELALISKYKYKTEVDHHSISKENYASFISFFPSFYLESSIRNMYTEHYVACFSEHNDDASMWAHYAQGHRGVCLVFEFDDSNGSYFLEMDEDEKIALHKVKYSNNPPKINAFESIGYLSMKKLMKSWLTFDNKVSCIEAVYRDSYATKYWERYYQKVLHKFSDWQKEDEHRMVKSSWYIGKQTKDQRVLHYKSRHLKGLIFGIRTPEDTQIRLLQILDKTLSNDEKKDFRFYKAGYSSINKKLEVAELSLLKFEIK